MNYYINMYFGLIYYWWINLKFVNLDLWVYCIWWLILDMWIISITYCLFYLKLSLLLIGYLFGFYWIELEILFPLTMYIIDVSLLIYMNFGHTIWVKIIGWLEYLIWAWPIWTIKFGHRTIVVYIKLGLDYGILNLGPMRFIFNLSCFGFDQLSLYFGY